CASLSCRMPGFPDRLPRRADGEAVFFVLRKREDSGVEYAWIPDGPAKGWSAVDGSPRQLVPGEERLPLLPAASDSGRTLFHGYVPVASAQSYAVPAGDLATTQQADPRMDEISDRFRVPLTAESGQPSMLAQIRQRDPRVARDVSVFLLLGLWEFFAEHID